MLNPLSREMEYYDIYPKVFLVNKETEITTSVFGSTRQLPIYRDVRRTWE